MENYYINFNISDKLYEHARTYVNILSKNRNRQMDIILDTNVSDWIIIALLHDIQNHPERFVMDTDKLMVEIYAKNDKFKVLNDWFYYDLKEMYSKYATRNPKRHSYYSILGFGLVIYHGNNRYIIVDTYMHTIESIYSKYLDPKWFDFAKVGQFNCIEGCFVLNHSYQSRSFIFNKVGYEGVNEIHIGKDGKVYIAKNFKSRKDNGHVGELKNALVKVK